MWMNAKIFFQLKPAKDITYKYNCWHWLYFCYYEYDVFDVLLIVYSANCIHLREPYPDFQMVGSTVDAAHPTAGWAGVVQIRKEAGLLFPPLFPSFSFLCVLFFLILFIFFFENHC